MPPALPLITLLTDFGDRDWFVGAMKGVILSIHPDARIVDLSHQVAPHQIKEAAYILHACYRSFPEGTIHVCVVDPGVGSDRRPLLVSSSRYYFLAPDNGLLSYVMKEDDGVEVRQIENRRYRIDSPGKSFDGRDLFAPAAAWLAKGEPVASFGRLLTDPVRLNLEEPVWRERQLIGQIIYIDRFGNLISNLTTKHLRDFRRVTKRADPVFRIAGQTIGGLVTSYSLGNAHMPSVLVNSSGQLEVFLKEASAAKLLKQGVGASLDLE
ncbi:MAG: SAM-dependent chlorinase/fluorinase [Nitrospirae bacterium]|nr:SAM-dependent chlorinase/fluorinase [Nitrospirota bacterium]